jgi:asparagine synthase (glutamine-hydrolysing)
MYAIAIYADGILKLYRDPAGKKPLYYRKSQGRFCFASESRALLAEEGEPLDREQIPLYLSYQSPVKPHTFYRGVQQLGAGEILTFEGDHYRIDSGPSPLAAAITITEEKEATNVIESALREAVSIRIPQKVPYAALLSGGLDSSLIAAMAAREGPLRSYCIGYEGYGKYDERSYAREAAAFIGSDHHEVIFSKEDFFRSIEESLEILDEPLADPAMLPLSHMMRHIAGDGIKVVLTGDGSDELFLGYKNYFEQADVERAASLQHKNWLKNYFRAHFSLHREWEWYKRVFEGSLLFRSSAELFTDMQQNRLLKANIKENRSLDAIKSYREEFEAYGRTAVADWYSFLDLRVMLGEVFLKKLDRVSMANGIEARTPFLDREVVTVAFAIDPDLRMGSVQKQLIKDVARNYLPRTIIERKKKGFNYPFLEWLLEENALTIIETVQKDTGLFYDAHLQYLLEKGKQGMFRQQLFSLFMLSKWIAAKGIQ